MTSRRTNLQSIGSLIGQAVAHGLLYGGKNREKLLYEWQARDKAERFGRISDEERDFVTVEAVRKGGRQIREAERSGKITVIESRNAERLLDNEVDSVVGKLFPADRGGHLEEVSRDNEEWDR